MKQATDKILSRVLSRTHGWHFREAPFNWEMVRILKTADGRRSMGEIARILDSPLNELLANTLRLISLGLLETPATLPCCQTPREPDRAAHAGRRFKLAS